MSRARHASLRVGLGVVGLGVVALGCSSSPSESTETPDVASAEAPIDTTAEPIETTEAPDVAPADTSEPFDAVAVPIESTGSDELRDLIRSDDPSTLTCVVDLGAQPGEFYDKVTDQLLFAENTNFFEARYADGATVEIRVHPDLGVGDDALVQARRVAEPIGLLPTELRSGIERVGFLDGDGTAQADGGGEGIHVYAVNVAQRERANRFEETLFHESVHTSLDDLYAASAQWLQAQTDDGEYLTDYSASQPAREDLAETALYAWALIHHPDRVSPADALAWKAAVPNRIAVIESILSGPATEAAAATC